MVEVANPNAGVKGERRTILVFRTWTLDDAKAALKGITPHKEDIERCEEELRCLITMYHLNGQEVQTVFMQHLA